MEPETQSLELKVDTNRLKERYEDVTGIYIRAKADEKWGSYDIAQLDKESLLLFLRSRGGNNPWAEDCVGIMLGHGHLHKAPSGGRDGKITTLVLSGAWLCLSF